MQKPCRGHAAVHHVTAHAHHALLKMRRVFKLSLHVSSLVRFSQLSHLPSVNILQALLARGEATGGGIHLYQNDMIAK